MTSVGNYFTAFLWGRWSAGQQGGKVTSEVNIDVVCICGVGAGSCIRLTVFRGPQNFEPSRGICFFPRNFDISAEFCRSRKMTGD